VNERNVESMKTSTHKAKLEYLKKRDELRQREKLEITRWKIGLRGKRKNKTKRDNPLGNSVGNPGRFRKRRSHHRQRRMVQSGDRHSLYDPQEGRGCCAKRSQGYFLDRRGGLFQPLLINELAERSKRVHTAATRGGRVEESGPKGSKNIETRNLLNKARTWRASIPCQLRTGNVKKNRGAIGIFHNLLLKVDVAGRLRKR